MVWLLSGLVRSSDRLIPEEGTCPMIAGDVITCTILYYAIVYSNTVSTKIGTSRKSDVLQLCAAPRQCLPTIYF